jgi:hypothetical protein
VLRINIDTDCLQTAKNYLYILAGIVYCVQVLALEKLLLRGQRNTQIEQDYNYFLAAQHMLAYSKYIRLTASNLGNAY